MQAPPLFIIDTNVVLAGIPSAQGRAPFEAILRGMRDGAFPFAVSAELIDEYVEVLLRPELSQRHGMNEAQIKTLVESIVAHAEQNTSVAGPPAPDPGDQFLWDLLAALPTAVLVTLDKRLLRDRRMRGRVIPPTAYLKLLPTPLSN